MTHPLILRQFLNIIVLIPLIVYQVNSKNTPWQYFINSDFTDTITQTSQPSFGKEVVLPINVDDPLDEIATAFFNTIDTILKSRLKNLHGANYVYHAHHTGRNTEYFNQTNQEFKGWIALASGTGLTIQWEGDLEACTVIKDTSSHSNQECTFDNIVVAESACGFSVLNSNQRKIADFDQNYEKDADSAKRNSIIVELSKC